MKIWLGTMQNLTRYLTNHKTELEEAGESAGFGTPRSGANDAASSYPMPSGYRTTVYLMTLVDVSWDAHRLSSWSSMVSPFSAVQIIIRCCQGPAAAP
jgi:hypothetical protein